MDVAVVVEGTLPGFTEDQLEAYISQEMAAAHVSAWHFEPAGSATTSPNRVVWRFRLLPYAGGTVRYIGPMLTHARDLFGVRRAIGVDARLYVNGLFQSTTFDQATIKGGPKDPDLGAIITKVTKSIIANALDETPRPNPAALAARPEAAWRGVRI